MWSVGCIFAELLGRKPLFPGDDYIHELQIICDKRGTPSEEELNFVTSEKVECRCESTHAAGKAIHDESAQETQSTLFQGVSQCRTAGADIKKESNVAGHRSFRQNACV